MSGILDAFGTKKHRVLYSGSITGDPVRKDPAASRRYVQMRLLDCFLQRKHKEALLLLDALLVDREIRITVYWKALIALVQELLPDRLEEVLRGSFNSMNQKLANFPQEQAMNAMLRYLASKGQHKDLLEWLQMHNNLKNTASQKVAALSSLKKIDPHWSRIERSKKIKSWATAAPLGIDTPDSEQDSSDSEADGDEVSLEKNLKTTKKRKHSADHAHAVKDDAGDRKNRKKAKRVSNGSDDDYIDHGGSDDSDDDYVEDPDRISKESGWSMPPRTFHFDMWGCNVPFVTRSLNFAGRDCLDVGAVKLRLKATAHGHFMTDDVVERALSDFYEALKLTMDQSVNNLPLVRILLPYFSHYSDEWFELMERHCRLDPVGDLDTGLKRLERRCRKLIKRLEHYTSVRHKYTNTMIELLLERIGHGCLDQWTLNKAVQWLDLCEPDARQIVCCQEAWLYKFLQAECLRAPSDVVSLIEKLQKYFENNDTQ